jgi:hypothetical protein
MSEFESVVVLLVDQDLDFALFGVDGEPVYVGSVSVDANDESGDGVGGYLWLRLASATTHEENENHREREESVHRATLGAGFRLRLSPPR